MAEYDWNKPVTRQEFREFVEAYGNSEKLKHEAFGAAIETIRQVSNELDSLPETFMTRKEIVSLVEAVHQGDELKGKALKAAMEALGETREELVALRKRVELLEFGIQEPHLSKKPSE